MKYTKNELNFYTLSLSFVLILLFKSTAFAQNNDSKNKEIPQEIQVTTIAETIRKLDSTIDQTKNLQTKIKIVQQKGQLLLQTNRIKEAKEVYEQGIDLFDEDISETQIKILAGLGAIADLEGNQEKATLYFTDAYSKTKEIKSTTGYLWILYHEGENYIIPELFSKDELKVIEKYAGRYLYSKPQLTLAASNWMIQHCGEQIVYAESGYVFAGLVYRDWGQFDKALEQFYKAVEIRENIVFEDHSKYASMLNIATIYDMQGEREKSLEIIEKVVEDAKRDQDDWGLAYALKDIAITLMLDGKYEASISHFLQCIPVMQKLKDVRGEGVCYANLGNIYSILGELDKADNAIEKALKLLKASNYDQLYASTFLIKAFLYEKQEKWEEAKDIASKSLVTLKRINSLEHIINAYHVYLNYYTHKNNAVMVQKYTDSILEVNNAYYEKSRLFESEKLKVRYETEKKEVQLNIQKKLNVVLQEEASLHKKLRNTMFFILLLSIIVLLLFFNKYKLQNKLVYEREKRNVLEKKQLEETMNHKQRELTSLTLQMLKKNELLQELEQSLKKIEQKNGNNSQEEVRNLKSMLQSQNRLDQDWSNFKVHFDGVHPNFFEKLSKIANLTQQDLRHSSYIKMGLATKEIAQLMNISASSVQMARYRLKKKLSLNRETDIYTFIQDLQ
ncbi:tetratricopeptide repeat protein [Kordia sp.]|uniref:tetratricopeptide repeat protein n=1 Tax=Kordia sp. TaxID=1965332 RepID=UPI003B5B28E7